MSSNDQNGIKITTVAGPPLVAIILNWALFGILSLQVYLYSQAFPNDKPWLKILVWAVYLLEMLQTLLLTDTVWKMLVNGFGEYDALDEIGTTWLSVCVIGGLTASLVKWFYAYRIAVFSQRKIIPGVIIFLSLTSFSGAVADGVSLKNAGKFSNLFRNNTLRTYNTVIGLWEGAGFACDVIITVCMCYYLNKRSQHGRFSQTGALVSKMIRMTIETGALTATISLLTLAMYYPPIFHNGTYFEVPACVQAKFYSTTLLAVLNNRMMLGIVSESMAWRDNELGLVPPHPRDTNRVQLYSSSTSSPLQNTTVHVTVTKEEVVTTDDGIKVHYLAPPELSA